MGNRGDEGKGGDTVDARGTCHHPERLDVRELLANPSLFHNFERMKRDEAIQACKAEPSVRNHLARCVFVLVTALLYSIHCIADGPLQ